MVLGCDWLLPRWRIDLESKTIKKEKRRNKGRIYLNKFAEYFGLLTLGEGPGDHLPVSKPPIVKVKANKKWR